MYFTTGSRNSNETKELDGAERGSHEAEGESWYKIVIRYVNDAYVGQLISAKYM